MRGIFLVCFFYCATLLNVNVVAQQNHFIYLQAENKQPFYIKMDKKVFSSSESGYVIIPKLVEGNYIFRIGFPKSEIPEQVFNYTVAKKDVGFAVKNFGEKGWGLFDLQSLEIIMPGATQAKTTKNVTKELPHQNTEIAQAETRDNASKLIKISQHQDENGISMVFLETKNQKTDTIQLLIPSQNAVNNKSSETVTQTNIDTTKQSFLPIELPNSDNPVATDTTSVVKSQTSVDVSTNTQDDTNTRNINTHCKSLATEEDFFKLRKKMAAENNEDGMISVARKSFKNKCYRTEHIKNLGLLFLGDQGKYKFYDIAYPAVFDLYNFPTLQVQLSDQYYINRFKAMLHN